LSFAISSDNIYAGTYNGVIWKRALSELGINEPKAQTSKFNVRCYPNPVNSLLVVSYSLPEKSNINIGIYDLMGREVKELGIRSYELGIKGEQKISIDVGGLNSGVYFVKLNNQFVSFSSYKVCKGINT